eukprot:g20116.t1
MAAGIAILVHGGMVVSQMRQNATHHVDSIPIYVILEIFVGALVSLYGSIGRFEPIRVSEAPRVTWESQHQRNDFIMYRSRAAALCAFIEHQVELPPGVKDK